MKNHPDQPLVKDSLGVVRFKGNKIVQFLLDDGPNDMNRLARIPFSDEDRQQFAQLIGYSLNGYSELSYVSDEAYERAAKQIVRSGKGKPVPPPPENVVVKKGG